MYEDLIEGLRVIAKGETDEIFSEAADAIEELQRENEKLHNDLGKALRKIAKYRWIPVTERLPKYNEIVLISNGKSVGDGFLEHRHNIKGEEYDRWFTHFSDIEEEEVTWWMSLPEPPKDGE